MSVRAEAETETDEVDGWWRRRWLRSASGEGYSNSYVAAVLFVLAVMCWGSRGKVRVRNAAVEPGKVRNCKNNNKLQCLGKVTGSRSVGARP